MPIIKVTHTLLFPFAIALYGLGFFLLRDVDICFLAVLLLFFANVLFAIDGFAKRSIFFLLLLGLGVFIISRPLIDLLEGATWWFAGLDSAWFSANILFITLVCLRVGAFLAEWRQANVDAKKKSDNLQSRSFVEIARGFARDTNEYLPVKAIRLAAGVVFLLAFVFAMYLGYVRLGYMAGHEYEYLYTVSINDYTTIVERTLATMEPYALYIFLATFPKKRVATIALILHVITSVPLLIIGGRAGFILNVLFFIFYYFIRDSIDGKGAWVGTVEKTVGLIAIPVVVLAMGLITYLRSNILMADMSLLGTLVDSLYKQGVTFDVLNRGYIYDGYIQQLGPKFYTVGTIIDYFTQGPIGRYVFDIPSLRHTNSIEIAVQGNLYAHTLAYYSHWNYLGGEGFGSSYLLESYADAGYLGVGLFSGLLGAILVYLPRMIKSGWLLGTIALAVITTVFFMPRGDATDGIMFIFTLQFWFTIVVTLIFAYLIRPVIGKSATRQIGA
jgi:oligosaccharide repeat unit polymerase